MKNVLVCQRYFLINVRLTRERILAAIHEKGPEVPVSEIMERDFLSVSPETPMDDVYGRLRSRNNSSMLVTEGEEVKGTLCLDGIRRYLMIQAALKKAGQEA